MTDGYVFFEIQADDVQRAVQFYGSVFGWKFTEQPYAPVQYLDIETGGARGGLLKRSEKTPPTGHGTNAFVCSLEVEDFDETAKKILGGGGRIALDKFPIPGRFWQGYFIDPDGNTFGIFQVDEHAA